MRDHAILEQQRQQQQRDDRAKLHHQHQHHRPIMPPSVKVPIQNLSSVPPQVLEVQTKLENPTKYHVIQKQKSQVKQYLSESFQQHGNTNYFPGVNLSYGQTHSAPVSSNNNLVPNTGSINFTSHSQPYNVPIGNSPNFDGSAMSPALSSGATSTSEVRFFLVLIFCLCKVKLANIIGSIELHHSCIITTSNERKRVTTSYDQESRVTVVVY